MNNKRNASSIWGTGLALIAVGIAVSARPVAAQPVLLAHPAQVQQVFGDWNRDHNQDRNYDRNQDRNHDRDHNRLQERRRAEQARRDAERARHEAEVRHIQWLREHRSDRDRNDRDRNDRDRNRNDSSRDWRHDNR